jgi:hypothetical protein
VLYEEDPSNDSGKRYVGTAIWRIESIAAGPGQTNDVAVRAEIEIPEPRVTVKWSLRRNTDKALPASHTIEIMFSLPPDFPNGGISNIPGILMKQAEQTRGLPLTGLAVKMTTGFFPDRIVIGGASNACATTSWAGSSALAKRMGLGSRRSVAWLMHENVEQPETMSAFPRWPNERVAASPFRRA